jgi:hypothetical protein
MTDNSNITNGGIHVFSQSLGLDVGINDVDLNLIPGHAVVAIICRDCGHAPIGKVLVSGWRTWLNHYGTPHTEDYLSRRAEVPTRIPAPRIVLTDLLQGPGYPNKTVWCEKHGEKIVSNADIFSAIARAKAQGKGVVRLAV